MGENLFESALSLREAVYQAVGAASTAWEDLDMAGAFNEQWATRVAEDLLDTIAKFERGEVNA